MKKFELPFVVEPNWLRKVLFIALICWMSAYPIYTSFYKANAVEQYQRHLDYKARRSMFYNPWQYRVLCPMVIEGTYQILDHTVYPILNIKGIELGLPGDVDDKNENTQKLISLLRDPVFIKYIIVFLGFRFFEHVVILYLLFSFLSIFVSNNMLRWLGLIFATLFMGNGVVDSDLTFNTYLDIIVYLWAGIVIANNLNYWWIVLITIIGALNRETSVLIPAMFFLSKIDWAAWPNFGKTFFSNQKALIVTFVSGLFFVSIFVLIRVYFGFQPQSSWRVAAGWPMLKLNLFSSVSVKTYMELFGVFAFFPIWSFFVINKSDPRLKILFFSIVPAWFAMHFVSAIAYQTRLFLVPTLLVIIPSVLEYIESRSKQLK